MIRRVAHEDVVEAVIELVLRFLATDELFPRQRPEMSLDLRPDDIGHERLDSGLREEESCHGRRLDHRTLRKGKPVEPRGEQRLDRPGDRELGEVLRGYPAPVLQAQKPFVDEHRQQLLDKEGIALRCSDDTIACVRRQPGVAEKMLDHQSALCIGERCQLEESVVPR